MKAEIILTLLDKTIISAYDSDIIPIINDAIFISESSFFEVQKRFLNMSNNKVILIGIVVNS